MCCTALICCHALCAALPLAASAALCGELHKRRHYRHHGLAQMRQLAGTCRGIAAVLQVQARRGRTQYMSQLRVAVPIVHLSASTSHML